MSTKTLVLPIMVIALVVAGLAFSPLAPNTASSPMQQAQGLPLTISVTGSGTAYSSPDIAEVILGVEISNEDVSAAVDEATAKVEAVIAAVEASGVDEDDVRTEHFNIWRESFYGPEGPTGDGVFRVTHVLRITVHNIEAVADILKAALEAGANSVQGVNFNVEDRAAVESEARQMAVDDARMVAQELAELMGASVGEVISISETMNFPGQAFLGGGGGGAADMAAVNVPPIDPGALGINITVNITFELVR